ncbi:MAG: VTT domain-containing protein [Bacteroidales bacterium]|nr:VTT domain-containing protein [Bacteroidales bacterium]
MSKKSLQILFFITVGIVVFAFFYFDLYNTLRIEHIETVKQYFLSLGVLAPAYMIILYILFNLAAIPRVFFTIFSGYIFGLFYGFLFAWLATIAGLIVTFISIRYLFKEKFVEKFGEKQLVEKLNKLIEQGGFLMVVFLRAIYIVPSSVLNYSFGFTKIKTLTYLIASAIGFIPVVFINVYAGYEINKNITSSGAFDYTQLIAPAIVMVFVFFLIKFLLKKFKLTGLLKSL